MTLITIDAKNVFNMIPHKAVIISLKNKGVNHLLIEYIEIFIKQRWCEVTPNVVRYVKCGVA